MKRLFTCLTLLVLGASLHAQSAALAQDILRERFADYELSATDVQDLRVTDAYASPDGTEHVYVSQYYQGVEIDNAQAILHFKGEELVSTSVNLRPDLPLYKSNAQPALAPHEAVFTAVDAVAPAFGQPIMTNVVDGEYRFVWPAVSPDPLRATLTYLQETDGLRLAWRVLVDRQGGEMNYYQMLIDATKGRVIRTDDLVLHCDFGPAHPHAAGEEHAHQPSCSVSTGAEDAVDGASYRVIPFGEESPIHGDRVLEVNPADPTASPFGWHDTDGQTGPEFTITRGNNVYAYPDRDLGNGSNDNTPDGPTAEGGDQLKFDFFFSEDATIDDILEASLTQAFYTTNKLHDWLFQAGFDEASGNFQQTNYTGLRGGGDAIDAEVQDGSGRNNANFATPSDGFSPRMQMQIFNPESSFVEILAPAGLRGSYDVGTASFGVSLAAGGEYRGSIVEVNDGSAEGNLGCSALVNPGEVAGKIALVTRGGCTFESKTGFAEDAGAIAVVICNNAPGIVNMSGPGEREINIPAVSMQQQDCERIRLALEDGQDVRIELGLTINSGTDSDFDAGIVAHEFGHGVSNRLVGGPSNTRCLRNDEQMGEGWSDFFTLASTPQTVVENPDGTEGRGIGNYAIGGTIAGRGIRSQRYSTDPAINNKEYNDIIYTGFDGAPHPVGEVWAATLWDVYWYLTNEYGFDDDLVNGSGGNNRAVQLVVEGMKYTRCSPSMVDARDGILEANRLLFGSRDQCELYGLFASRGIGFSADGGSSDDRTDNRQAFDLTPYCTEEIRLTKRVDESYINAGEQVRYLLTAFSYRPGTTPDVTITDTIPAGMTIVQSSITGPDDFSIDGNVVTFTMSDLAFEQRATVVYDVETDERLGSTTYFFDGAEAGSENWNVESDAGNRRWEQTDTTPLAGGLAWYVVNLGETNDQSLELKEPISIEGDQPALRFFTKYRTEAAYDAGLVETSTNGRTWTRLDDAKFLRGGYRGEVAPGALDALAGKTAFWGESDGYEEIIIDLSHLKGREVYVRFRFLSDGGTAGRGWWVDDIEVLDVFNYQSTATLRSGNRVEATAKVEGAGVIAANAILNDVTDSQPGQTTVSVYPNPAGALTNVRTTTEQAGSATVQLLTVDGRTLITRQLELLPGGNVLELNTGDLPSGVYTVRVAGERRVHTTKLIVH